MQRKIQLFILIPILALCTGCFEIVEQVSIKEGGSGTYKLIANFSQSKGTLQGLMAKDSVMGAPIPSISEINAEIEKVRSKFASMKGISNVTVKKDYNNYIFNVTCQFSSVSALDQALANTVGHFSKNKQTVPTGNYSYSGKVFKRQIMYDYAKDVSKNMNSQFKSIMEQATFMGIYQFPGTIKSVSNANAKISPNRKATMLKVNLLAIAQSKSAIANTIVMD